MPALAVIDTWILGYRGHGLAGARDLAPPAIADRLSPREGETRHEAICSRRCGRCNCLRTPRRSCSDGSRRNQMGNELGRIGARPLSSRQCIGAARPALCVSGSGQWCPQPDLSDDGAAGCLGPAGPAALLQCIRHQGADARRRLCGARPRRAGAGQRLESARDVRRQARGDDRAGRAGVERSGRSWLRARRAST